MTNWRVPLAFVSLLLASGASAQIASDSNVSTKLTGNLVPHFQTGRHLRVAPWQCPGCPGDERRFGDS